MRISIVVFPALTLLTLIVFGAASIGRILNEKKADAAEIKESGKGGGEEKADPVAEKTREKMDVKKSVEAGGKLVQTLEDGARITYTLHPKFQKRANKILQSSDALGGSLILIDVKTGKILVLAEYRSAEYEEEALPVYFSAKPPAASLFKIVTASALLDEKAADDDTVVCYHGGSRKIHTSNLESNPEKDKTCVTLAFAMGKSLNSVFAKLADGNLTVEELETAGRRFGFDKQIPLQYRLVPQVSEMDIPGERLEFARMAAGFWHVHLTPLHAAMIVQAVANDGQMMEPFIVDQIEDAKGKVTWKSSPGHFMQCIDEEDADTLTEMLIETVSRGTARKHFVDPKGTPYLPGIKVAGKTGSLSQKTPYRFYSWFIGFAPADNPEVAIASLAINGQQWKMKGSTMARELLRWYFLKLIKQNMKIKK